MMKSNPIPVQPIQMSKDELDFWKSEIRSSLKRQRDDFINRIGYDELVRYFEAMQFPGNKSMLAIVDEFSPAILSVITSVYYQNPTVQVEPANPKADGPVKPSLFFLIQNPDFVPFSLKDLLQSSLRYGMKKSGMKEEMQLATFDFLLAGYACVEMNHKTERINEEPMTDIQDDFVDGFMDKLKNGAKTLVDNVKQAVSGNKEEVEEKALAETDDLRTDLSDKTYCKRYNPLDVLFDPRADVFKESRWVGKKVRMTLADFNRQYPKLKGRLTPSSSDAFGLEYTDHKNRENKKAITLYEVEIKKKGPRNCVLVFHPSIDEPIDYYERPIISNKFALKYGCIDKYGKIYPMSRGRKAKGPQDDINHYMTIQFEHVDRAQRKIGVYMGGLTESGKAAQRSSDVYAFVEKSVPGPVYEAMPAPSVVPENKEIVVVMRDALNKTIGTTELAKAGKSQNDTLGQDQLETNAFQVNVNSVQDALQDLADEVIDELKDIQQQLWDDEDYFKVSGIKGATAWYDPTMGPLSDLLVGDYAVNCNIASAMRPNPLKDRKDAMDMTSFITSPPIMMFAQMHGKRPSMEPLNNLVKSFGQNPEMVFEDFAPPPMMPPTPIGPGAPPPVGGGAPPIPAPPMVDENAGAV